MSITSDGTITGQAQTGLTSPTYTTTVDVAPSANGKQWAITALGGTQTGVDAHSVSKPFTVSAFKPTVMRQLGTPNPVTGVVTSVPRNTYKIITRKGVNPLTGQPMATMLITTSIEVPAGGDTVDPEDVRAAVSLHLGFLVENSAGIGDTCVNGIL